MEKATLDLSPTVHEAFASVSSDSTLLALPLTLTDGTIQPLPPVHSKYPNPSSQIALNQLNAVLDPRTPLYLVVRRNDSLVAITYVPYLAKEDLRKLFLNHRQELVRQLGEERFSQALICKEIGEIIDARSWEERDSTAKAEEACEKDDCNGCAVKDLGYKRNKCRLCDRRMKNKISHEALEALKTLHNPGAIVQICVDIPTDALTLAFTSPSLPPSSISSHIPTTSPSFTFYHHPTTHILYFIFHSPDSAPVQSRMKHTLAIPGLIVHAEDAGVHIDQRIEMHDPDDLVFGERDERIGKFRSMYLRNRYEGTEAVYEGMESDKKFLDAV